MSALTVTPMEEEVACETCQTCEADGVSNNEFLRALFADLPDEARPMIVSFAGNPSTVKPGAWRGQSWAQSGSILSDAHNNYFSLSAFLPSDDGAYKRKKSQFFGCYCIMLDDIGTKVEKDAITLEPSWIIETSQGNYQAGYILSSPIQEIEKANQLMDAVVAAGLCDPGAKGPSARLARLPVAINGKHDPVFDCRLTHWNSEARFSVDELVQGLGLALTPAAKNASPKQKRPAAPVASDEAVWSPQPATNPVVEALQEKGLYKSLIEKGKHDITCPWVNEHTGAVDHGTAYFEPDGNWPIGGFSCLHGHCTGRGARDLLEFLQVPEQTARMKPVVRLVEGALDKVVDAAERVLAESGSYYQLDGRIVTINTNPSTRASQIVEVSVEELTLVLACYSDWLRFDGRREDWMRKDPPARHVNTLYGRGQYQHVPILKGLARQPFLRDDDSLVAARGYDSHSQMYGAFNAEDFAVPEEPSQDEACAALEMLNDLLKEFEFVDDSDRAAALCAILTASVRPSLPTAPMFHVMAHVPGSGKSYLCALISAFAAENKGQPTAFPKSDEECHKVLLAELLRAPAVLEFDNITTDLRPHNSLCSVLTDETMRGRLLGQSKTLPVSTRTLFLSSGNNVGPIADMIRRCMTIGLTCSAEHPAQRTFKRPDLLADVRRNRGMYVSAALTIIRAWVSAGKPMQQINNLSGYDRWSQLCRHSLVWVGCSDPAENLYRNMHHDPEREVLRRFYSEWTALFGARPLKARDVLKRVTASNPQTQDFAELLQDIAGDHTGAVKTRSLGRWLAKHNGRIVGGQQLVKAHANTAGDTWVIK